MKLKGPPYRTLLIAFALAASAAAVLTLPGEREKIALHERDGKISDALGHVSGRLSAGKHDAHLLDAAVRLHLRLGDLDAAVAAAELHAAAFPDNLAAQIRLLDLLRDRGQHERYLALAKRVYDRWQAPQILRDLLDLYRLRQHLDAEVRLLELATGIGQAMAADIERLGMIKAAQGDYAAALQLLNDADGTRDGIDRSARFTLLHLLLEQDRPDEATRRAMKWLATNPDDAAAAQFCADLALSGHVARAVTITRQINRPESEIYVACVERVSRRGEAGIAADLLLAWVAENRSASAQTVDRFVRVALTVGRPDLALAFQSGAKSYALSPAICPQKAFAGGGPSDERPRLTEEPPLPSCQGESDGN
jgi:tetratricopeptide (TPR) repeat protein